MEGDACATGLMQGCLIPGHAKPGSYPPSFLLPACCPPLPQVNDRVNEAVCQQLEEGGVKFIALRCAGFDKVPAWDTCKFTICVRTLDAGWQVASRKFTSLSTTHVPRPAHEVVY